MVEIKTGSIVNFNEKKTGEGGKGTWAMVPVTDDKGKKRITVWADNAEEVKNWTGQVKVKEIISVKYSARKYQERWYEDVSVVATLERLTEADMFSTGFSEVEQTEIPFA